MHWAGEWVLLISCCHVLDMNVFLARWLVRAEEIAKTTTGWTHELLLVHNLDCRELSGIHLRRDARLLLRLCFLQWRGDARPIDQAFFIVGLCSEW